MEALLDNNKILIVIAEDSPTQAAKLEYLLTERGYRVIVASNGTLALTEVLANKPDLVISDIIMPGKDGFELCHALKSDPENRHIPIILLTTLSESENILKAVDVGADFFFTKPYDEEHLLAKIEFIFNHIEHGELLDITNIKNTLSESKLEKNQMINLLVSTYEHVKLQNRKLNQAQVEIRDLNEHLNEKVKEKTSSLELVIESLKTTEAELIESKNKAEESNRLKSSLLSNMSHELRTPMNGILGFSCLLQEMLQEPTQKKMAESIQRSANRLMDTLNSIMDLSQLQADKTLLEIENLDIKSELEQLVVDYQQQAEAAGIVIKTNIAGGIYCLADSAIFKKIFQILVDNALKFTQTGSVSLSARKETDNAREIVVVDIEDTGIGIAEEHLEVIFDEFRQVSSGLGRTYEGNGLGLTLCRKFLTLLDGHIQVKSTLGSGSTFSVIIPLATDQQTISPQQEYFQKITLVPDKKVAHAPGYLPNVLIVEDNELNVHLVEIYLEYKYRLDSSFNGETAIQMAGEKQYDIILMDINLGSGLNGMETATEIRKIKGYEQIPIIAVTGYTSREEQLKIMSNGCSHFLAKPFKRDELIRILEKEMSVEM